MWVPAAIAMDLGNSLLSTDDWYPLLGAIVGLHAVLLLPFYLMVGTRRNTGAVMGGSDGDGKGKAEAKNGSMLCNLLAYNLLAIFYATFCAYTGTKAWFDGTADSIGGSLQERFYGYNEPNAKIARLTVAYELYNTLAVVLLKEYRTAAFVGHHATCLVLGMMSLHPFCHYYGLFFFGLTAISSVARVADRTLLRVGGAGGAHARTGCCRGRRLRRLCRCLLRWLLLPSAAVAARPATPALHLVRLLPLSKLCVCHRCRSPRPRCCSAAVLSRRRSCAA